jgi:hypothetical protein
MTASGKRRKTKTGFPFVSPSPWKSLRDSHIPTAPITAVPFFRIQFTRALRAPATGKDTHERSCSQRPEEAGALPLFQAHPALESTLRFRLTPRWN